MVMVLYLGKVWFRLRMLYPGDAGRVAMIGGADIPTTRWIIRLLFSQPMVYIGLLAFLTGVITGILLWIKRKRKGTAQSDKCSK